MCRVAHKVTLEELSQMAALNASLELEVDAQEDLMEVDGAEDPLEVAGAAQLGQVQLENQGLRTALCNLEHNTSQPGCPRQPGNLRPGCQRATEPDCRSSGAACSFLPNAHHQARRELSFWRNITPSKPIAGKCSSW